MLAVDLLPSRNIDQYDKSTASYNNPMKYKQAILNSILASSFSANFFNIMRNTIQKYIMDR